MKTIPKQTQKTENIFELLKGLKDHRRAQGQRHPLQIVLLIIILAIMAGAKSERAIARFAKNNKEALIKTLQIKREEVPSRSVTKAMIKHLDFDQLTQIFYQWSKQIIPIKKGEWISIDGKAIGGTVSHASTHLQNFISLVSVFVSKKKQVLRAGKISVKKESEIPKVKELIALLDLKGVTFTIDALHCQKETAKDVIESENNYILGVKGNQPKLYQEAKKTVKSSLQKVKSSPKKKTEVGMRLAL